MFSHMRTTVDIDDALLRAVKARAARERKALKEAFEQALRALLADPVPPAAGPPIPVFRGRGVQPGVGLTDGAALRDLLDAES